MKKKSLSRMFAIICVAIFYTACDGKVENCEKLEIVEKYHSDLDSRVAIPPFGLAEFPTTFKISWETVEKIKNENGKYVLVILGVKDNKLATYVMGSNKKGNAIADERPANYKEIKNANDSLRKLILPITLPANLGIQDFPLVVKMDTHDLVVLHRKTKCPYFICRLGIEPVKGGARMTIAGVASDESGNQPNKDYQATELCAAETWPDDNFTMTKQPSPDDVTLPEQ